MRKCDIVRKIAAETGLSIRSVERVMNDLKGILIAELASNGTAQWRGFGVFRVHLRAETMVILRGRRHAISARPQFRFKPGKDLSDALHKRYGVAPASPRNDGEEDCEDDVKPIVKRG